ncbi:MAG: hypothetical protein EPN25_15410 [Nitrospirae bacterium]|nr:MAG: hypothetical protein EPN25_15410 [Nitrospirota bacterium]
MTRIYIEKVADGIGTKGNTVHRSMEIHVYVGSVKNNIKLAPIKIDYSDDNIATIEVDDIVIKSRYIATGVDWHVQDN